MVFKSIFMSRIEIRAYEIIFIFYGCVKVWVWDSGTLSLSVCARLFCMDLKEFSLKKKRGKNPQKFSNRSVGN